MTNLTNLRALQLSAKIKHAVRRLQAIEAQVAAGLPEDPQRFAREYVDVMRYLRTIEEELAAGVREADRVEVGTNFT